MCISNLNLTHLYSFNWQCANICFIKSALCKMHNVKWILYFFKFNIKSQLRQMVSKKGNVNEPTLAFQTAFGSWQNCMQLQYAKISVRFASKCDVKCMSLTIFLGICKILWFTWSQSAKRNKKSDGPCWFCTWQSPFQLTLTIVYLWKKMNQNLEKTELLEPL